MQLTRRDILTSIAGATAGSILTGAALTTPTNTDPRADPRADPRGTSTDTAHRNNNDDDDARTGTATPINDDADEPTIPHIGEHVAAGAPDNYTQRAIRRARRVAAPAQRSVVFISADNGSHGTGFVAAAPGEHTAPRGEQYIITAAHVVENMPRRAVTVHGYDDTTSTPRILAANRDLDTAILKTTFDADAAPSRADPLHLSAAPTKHLTKGDLVTHIGHPFLQIAWAIFLGRYTGAWHSTERTQYGEPTRLTADIPVGGGLSGAPLLNVRTARVAGVLLSESPSNTDGISPDDPVPEHADTTVYVALAKEADANYMSAAPVRELFRAATTQ